MMQAVIRRQVKRRDRLRALVGNCAYRQAEEFADVLMLV